MSLIHWTVASLGLALISLVGCATGEGATPFASKVSLDSLGDIRAPEGYSAKLESLVGLPDSVQQGETYHVIARIRSNGEIPLVPGKDQLVPIGDARDAWGMEPVELIPAAGAPDSFFAEFDVTAPANPTPLQFGMVHGGGQEQQGDFGNRADGPDNMMGSSNPVNFYASGYYATPISGWCDIPWYVEAGSTFTISLMMQNTGLSDWYGSDFGLYNLVYPTWDVQFVPLEENELVDSSSLRTFTFDVTAPTIPGKYDMGWSMSSNIDGTFGMSYWRREITVYTRIPEPTISKIPEPG